MYKSDQEPAIKSCLDAAFKQLGVASLEEHDLVMCAVPEHSAVGASASNGKADRSVQMLEDQARPLNRSAEAILTSDPLHD